MKILSKDLRKWGKDNDWYNPRVHTNELKFNRQFSADLKEVMLELGFHNQNVIAMLIHDAKSSLLNKCRKFDEACWAGCRNEEEDIELQYIHERVLVLLEELAGLLERAEAAHGSDTNSYIEDSKWMTFTEAAELLAVSKGTVSKWADKGIFDDNGKIGQTRRLLKSSVLVFKQGREDKDLERDAADLRRDAANLERLKI